MAGLTIKLIIALHDSVNVCYTLRDAFIAVVGTCTMRLL